MSKLQLLFSQNKETVVKWFDKYTNSEDHIKSSIIEYLTNNPTDVLEHCKEFNKSDLRKYAGYNIIGFYGVNPKNNEISKIVTKNNKDYYITLKK